jgi:hypothetical protein
MFGALVALSPSGVAQCDVQWQPGSPASGPAGSAGGIAVLANGDIIAGGQFRWADATPVDNIARFDGTTWHPLGAGLNGAVFGLVKLANDDVVVSGQFTQAGGQPANHIARWDGATWSPLGTGLDNYAMAFAVMPNGDLIAGGSFLQAGGVPANRIARWDGTAWSPLGSGLNSSVTALAVRPNGDLVVGGGFWMAGGLAAQNLAAWDGSSWSAISGLQHPSSVVDVAVLPNGDLAVSGYMQNGLAVERLVILNGTTVQPLNPPLATTGQILPLANGDMVVGGTTTTGTTAGSVARWNGSAWTLSAPGAPSNPRDLVFAANGDLIVGGRPVGTGVTASNAVARYDGTTWTSLGGPRPPKVTAMARLPNGDVVLGGEFASFRGVAAANVAIWHAGVISPLGLGVNGAVHSLAVAPDGSVVVCGNFTQAGGGPANSIARWTGSAWATVGSGLPFVAETVAAAAGGQVLARSGQGQPQVRYFDGTNWSPLVLPQGYNLITFVGAPEGDFVLGGLFNVPFHGNTGTLRFDHGVISNTVPQIYMVQGFGRDVDGKVLAQMSLFGAYGIRRLEGNTWVELGEIPAGFVPSVSLSCLPNGDPLFATAYSTGNALQRYDGTAWSVFENSFDSDPYILPARLRAVSSGTGEVLVCGEFRVVGGQVNTGFAVALPGCPAAATSVGTGCTGSAGPVTLTADNLPWLGGTARATANGFPAASLGLFAIGTQPTTIALPLGGAGCSLYVVPDVLDVLLPGNGSAAANFAVPRNLALAGLQVRTQVVALEFDAGGALLPLRSSNALQLTLGGM